MRTPDITRYVHVYYNRKQYRMTWTPFTPSPPPPLKPRKHGVYGRYANVIAQRFHKQAYGAHITRLMTYSMRMARWLS